MKNFVVLAALLAVLYAMSYKMETRSTGSLRARLIKANQYHKYLEQQKIHRSEGLKKRSQTLMDYYDNVYIANVTIGTPGQTLSLLVDTSSSDLWVIDASCDSYPCNGYNCSGYTKHKFDSKKSSTFSVQNSSTMIIQQCAGWCDGPLVKDTVSIAGMRINRQKFLSTIDIAGVYGYVPMDGILGLAWPAMSQIKVTTPLQHLLPSLDAPLFTVWLDRKHNITFGGDGGLITYGSIDTTNCHSEINYVPLSSESYWQFTIDDFSIGDFLEKNRVQVLSDTGSSWFAAPPNAMDAVVNQTGAQYNYTYALYAVNCSTMETQPDLQFTINGVKYSIPSEEYILDLELGDGQCVLAFYEINPYCFGPSWVLGVPWIRTFCNIYDIGQIRIGFAKAIHSGL